MAKPIVARFEVTGRDGAALRRFYGDLLGWNVQEGAGGSGFGVVPPAKGGISGVISPDHSGGTGHVTFYVEVDDLAAYLARAVDLGGKTVVPPTDIAEFGLSFAFFADPERHVTGLSQEVVN